ncbi:chaplin [Streptomyces sp. NPDC031705]|uniref:chaplin n=1 Tax=Streptomyces sp. NPDC031705 TaxID=3155729 RepID=UPI0033F3DCEC
MRQVLSRQVLGKGVLTAAAASGLLSLAAGAACAHSAEASHSPGVLSGNSVSVPITVAPNLCGNSVDAGAALNPSFGNTCVSTTASDGGSHAAGHDHERHLSPERAEDLRRYLDEQPGGRHALPRPHHEEERESAEPRAHAPRHAAPRHDAPASWHAGGPHGDGPHADGPGDGGEEECDDHPPRHAEHPAPHSAPPAPHHPKPGPEVWPAPKPEPRPQHGPMTGHPAPLPAPAPQTPQPEEQPHTLPAPQPEERPGAELPEPRPPHGSQPVRPAPAPAPVPEAVRPADQPPAAPAGDFPVHVPSAPAPAPAPAHAVAAAQPAPAPALAAPPELAATGAGQTSALAALASALVLGGAILYRRSRIV